MPVAVITGAAGLVGSAAVGFFADRAWDIVGIDNDARAQFFGPAASTRAVRARMEREIPRYTHYELDIREQLRMARLFATYGRDIALVIHAAGQPSHDWAATAPLVDFDINATATLHMLEMTRQHCPDAVFIFVSTNKVYGDAPNRLPLIEQPTRWELDSGHRYAANGIDESMSVDTTLHSLFGCSKLSADVLVQEYGRYFGMRTGCFRCSCITGGDHAAVTQHGFLAHLMRCAVHKQPYVIYGYAGKQVRDNMHARDLVTAFAEFYANPRRGEIYNIGGGRDRSCSVQEAVALCERVTGNRITSTYHDSPRLGDHMWWITDVAKFREHHPNWSYGHDMESVLGSVYEGARAAQST